MTSRKAPDARGSADSHQSKYRADLDGLRAVAVLSVIIYHLTGRALPGGYLGVDIFFVISGYLITNIIWREALQREFSIARFYERRIRRILPALLVLLVFISGLAIALLLPIALEGYAKSVFASLTGSANIYFWRDTNYFSQLASETPLLHVWSLGVEEQFYILFPLLVVLCFRWRRSVLLPITAALVLLSFVANILAIRAGADSPAFFLLPARAWEIGAGALLALSPTVKIAKPWLRHTLALLAAALLLTGLCLFQTPLAMLLPSTLWVVLGSVLTIYLGNAGDSWLTLGLSWSPFVWIGLISYSLYLWHWPIVVFLRYYLVRQSLSPIETAAALALSFALAALSWRFVERPFRNRSIPIRSVLVWVLCGYLVTASASVAILIHHGFPSRFHADAARINAAVGTEYRCTLDEFIPFGPSHGCIMSLPSHNFADATVVLLGNSHAQMYAPLVTDILRANHRTGILVPLNGCLPMPDFNRSTECMTLAAKNLDAIEALPHVRIVILAMTWDFHPRMVTPSGQVSQSAFSMTLTQSLDHLIQNLKQRGKTVVLVGPISPPGWESASIVARQLAFGHRVDEPLFLPQSTFMAQQGDVIAHYASRNDILFIRPDLIQCQRNQCDYFHDGASIFADSSHIAESALPLFRPAFELILQQAFAQTP